jgi:hypothetical protein
MKVRNSIVVGLLLAITLSEAGHARSLRQMIKIPVAPKEAVAKESRSIPDKQFAPIDTAFVEASIRQIVKSWNGEGLAEYLDDNFQDKALLLSAIQRSVPMDAWLELLAVHNIHTLEQTRLPNRRLGQIGGQIERQSVVVATVELQISFNGQVKLPHTSQFYLQISEPEA